MDTSKDSSGKRRNVKKNKGKKDMDPSVLEDTQETRTLEETGSKPLFEIGNPNLSGFGMLLPQSGKKANPQAKKPLIPEYGTKEYYKYVKEIPDNFFSNPDGENVYDEAVGGTAVDSNTLHPPTNKQKPTRSKGSRVSVARSKASTASSLVVKKKEEEVKVHNAKSEVLKKIREIDRFMNTKELELWKAEKDICRRKEVHGNIPADTEDMQRQREEEIRSLELAKELEQEEYEFVKKNVLLKRQDLEFEIEGIEKEAELALAKLEEENDQIFTEEEDDSSEDEDTDVRVKDWASKSQAQQLKLKAEQQRIEDQKLAERNKIILEFQQEKKKAEAAFQTHQQLQEAKLAEILKVYPSPAHSVSDPPTPEFNPEAIPFTSYQSVPFNTQFLARQSHGKDLPFFSGNPEEWLTFKGAYERTQKVCGFSSDENLNRLQKCLKGDAAKFVQSLMTTPNNVPTIMKKLELRFGQPEFIIEAMTVRVRNTPVLKQDNSDGIIEFGGAVDNLVTTLQALKRPDHLFNPVLLKELELKMPLNWQIEWREWLNREEKTKDLSSFAEWLEGKTTIVCQLCPPKTTGSSEKKTDGNQRFRNGRGREKVMVAVDVGQRNQRGRDNHARTCICCSIIGHRIWDCPKFKEMTPPERNNLVKDKRLCEVCLSFGHRTGDCRSTRVCGKEGCRGRHNYLLHLGRRRTGAPQPAGQQRAQGDQQRAPENQQQAPAVPPRAPESACHANPIQRQEEGRVIYKILPLTLIGPNGEELDEFVFMDSASGITILDNGIADELHLKRVLRPFKFEGLGYTGNRPNSCVVEFSVRSKHTGITYTLKNVQTDDVNYLPQRSLSKEEVRRYDHLKDIPLHFYKNAKPKLLLGIQHADLMETIRRTDSVRGSGPIAAETKLGWVLTGTLPPTLECPRLESVFMLRDADEELHQLVKQHFTTEDFGVKITTNKIRSVEDKRAEEIMESTAKRLDGKWEMGLLWKEDDVNLPGSRAMAERRLKSVEKRMDGDPAFSTVYVNKIQEYLDKGFIRKLSPEELQEDNKTWYLPHFGVVHPNKPGKFRLVFDAAARSNGVSLNDKLLTGPDYVPSILSILFRFRQKAIAFTADIGDMFHKVVMKKEDQSAQRFLWRGTDRDRDPDVYVMQVMVFGAACSPSCAQYIKNRNAKEVGLDSPEAVRDIIDNHYVDDYLGSTDTVEEALERQQQVYEIHQKADFHICKWISNSPDFNSTIPEELRAVGAKSMEIDNSSFVERVLGLYWEPLEDKFTFRTVFHKIKEEVWTGERMPTKREALALVMSVYDQIGFLALFTVKAKMILQETWRLKVDWDEEIPSTVKDSWMRWIGELHQIPIFRVPRCYSLTFSTAQSRQLHVFVDASGVAFATVAYARIEAEGNVETSFLAAKAKVAPLKALSIPRMELQAAVMGTRLAQTIKKEHDFEFHETFYWTDSRTVLCWLRSDGRRFQQFVSHRVGEIQEVSDAAEWNWLSTKENVADEATRNTPSNWSPESRWVNGPDFLKYPRCDWPKLKERMETLEAELELKKEFVLMTTANNKQECPIDVTKFSSWIKLVRTTAYLLRFIEACKRRKQDKGCSGLSVSELRSAEDAWCRWSQAQDYEEEIQLIKSGEYLKRNNPIAKLTPILDKNGILRMKGRIPNEAFVYGLEINPIILHPKNPYTKLLIAHYHIAAGHHGMERVVNELRQQYCIPNIRVAVKRAWHECQSCKLRRAEPAPPLMGNLPLARLNSFVHPFTVTGLDYFGPMDITIGRRREKRYGALFTCMSTRAVHLELAASLSTDSCIMAIRRFIARRGYPRDIFSDNGTNFVGANNELKKAITQLNQQTIQDTMTTKGISWHFNPPAAPHMGGSWERLVKAVKVALEATLKERAPREEVLQTLFCEAENTVNGRPLTHVSCDPNDPEALTPNHFLVGRSSNIPSWRPRDDGEKCIRKLWEQGQQLADLFWKRWLKEYLPTLTKRDKWFEEKQPIEIGDIVILVDNNQPRNCWPKGRVTAVYPGKDGQVRTVEVKTQSGTYKRPAVKVIRIDVQAPSPEKKEDDNAVLFLVKTCSK